MASPMPRHDTVLITGANTGLGAAAARQLARPGRHLILTARTADKVAPVLADVRAAGARATFHELHLDDLVAASAAGQAAARAFPDLDVLLNNAGLAGRPGLSVDGYEVTFAVNHLGHHAFSQPLLAGLAARGGRVVNVASDNHYHVDDIPFSRLMQRTHSRTGLREYSVSKLANVLFTAELRRRYPTLEAVALNPGRIASDIWRGVPALLRGPLRVALRMRPVEVGGQALVHAVEVDLSGPEAPLYFDQTRARPINPAALRADLARALWLFSEDAVERATAAARRRRS